MPGEFVTERYQHFCPADNPTGLPAFILQGHVPDGDMTRDLNDRLGSFTTLKSGEITAVPFDLANLVAVSLDINSVMDDRRLAV